MLDAIRQHAQSLGVKIAFGTIIVVFVFWGLGSQKGDQRNVLATVNGQAITMQEFQKAYSNTVDNMRKQNPQITTDDLKQAGFKQQVFNQLLSSKVLLAEAERMGVLASPEEIREEIGRIPAFQNESRQFDKNRYLAVLQANRIQPAEFEADYRRAVLLRKLQDMVSATVAVPESEARDIHSFIQERTRLDYVTFERAAFEPKVAKGDEAIKAHYEANLASYREPTRAKVDYVLITPESLSQGEQVGDEEMKAYYQSKQSRFVQEEGVRARHILIKLAKDAPEAEVKKAQATLIGLQSRLQKGESFEELAKKLSQSPDNVQGGDLGWFGRGSMVKPFEDAAFALKPGQVSEPVRTEFGLHLIKVEERRENGLRTFDQSKDEIRRLLAEEKAGDKMMAVVDGFSEKALTGTEFAAAAKEFGLTVVTSPLFSMAEGLPGVSLKSADLETLFAMADGGITDTPLTLDNGYLFAKKIETSPERQLSLGEVKDKVAAAYQEQEAMRLTQAAADELVAKIKEFGDQALIGRKLQQSELFGRRGFVPGLGLNPELVQAAFQVEPGSWLPKTYNTGFGAVIVARAGQRVLPTDQEWTKDKDSWIKNIIQSKQNELFQAFTTNLVQQAEVKLVHPEVIQD